MKSFQEYLTLAKSSKAFAIDDSWAQGRSVFGGLTAALLLTHIEANTGFTDRELRSVNVHFCGALIANEVFDLNHQVISSGKSVTHVQAMLTQAGQIKTLITCCFASERPSGIEVNANRHENLPVLSDANKFPFIPGVIPNFIQHIDIRLNGKNFPFSGSDNQPITGWMKFEAPSDELNDSNILALIDAWPPAVLPLLKQPAPASSVTWNVEFIHPRSQLEANSALFYECEVAQAQSGLAHTEAKIYSSSGELVALSRQVVAVYDQKTN
ncbi:MAG: thioesterase family protein [Gammaproteobacteria bacterium]|nr:thioesterase family protein [Gammaproteobacteria bacterium]